MMLNGMAFRERIRGGSTETVKDKSVNVHLLFNGEEEDRDRLRQCLQEHLQQIKKIPLSKDRVGYLYYSMSIKKADPTIQINNVQDIIWGKHQRQIKTLVNFEGALHNAGERTKFCKSYDRSNPEDWDKLELQKVIAIYCNPVDRSLLSQHLLKAFFQHSN
eukprot:251666-Ditylum_brightwellii.AAC.1